MLGTDVPGLRTSFEIHDMGYICAKQTPEEIREMIRKIEARYDEMRENCHKFYDGVNLKEIVSSIIGEDE